MSFCVSICDEEGQFAIAFASYLNQKYQNQLTAYPFDNVDRLQQYLKSKEIDLCLISESICNLELEEKLMRKVEKLIFLSKERKDGCIYKYQSADLLANEIFSICDEYMLPIASMKNPFNEERAKRIGFYSPACDAFQSLYAIAFSSKYWSITVHCVFLSVKSFNISL